MLVSCGSRFILEQLAKDGYLTSLIQAGARILECGCGPCMGVDYAPKPGAVILRTSNRNFPGRSGTPDAQMYLCGVETAAASAVTGRLTSVQELLTPEALSSLDAIREPDLHDDDSMLVTYQPHSIPGLHYTEAIRPIPVRPPLEMDISAAVSLKLGDGISTDDIVPPKPQILALRPNIPELAKHLFCNLDPQFAARAASMQNSVIVAGRDYAQGSSREHAAAGCMQLGVRIVLAQSIHRIHRCNLINYGVIPLTIDGETLSALQQGDQICLNNAVAQLRGGCDIVLNNLTQGTFFHAASDLRPEEIAILEAGGLLPSLHREALL